MKINDENKKSAAVITEAHGVAAEVAVESTHLRIHISDPRSDIRALAQDLTADNLTSMAKDAWQVGIRAMLGAYAQAQQAQLEDVGLHLMQDLSERLKLHADHQDNHMKELLKRFFDPTDGQLTERLKGFMDDGGMLTRQLEKYLSAENSVLTTALAKQVGENSPLLKMLSPTEKDGVIQVLTEHVQEVMNASQEQLMESLDPNHENGMMNRFIKNLHGELTESQGDREKQLKTALKELDTNDEASALSRLIRETGRTQRSIMEAMNPSIPNSPLAILSQKMTELLEDNAKEQMERLERNRLDQEAMNQKILETVVRLDTQRKADQKSTAGGNKYEDAMVNTVEALLANGNYLLDATGAKPGKIRNCKKGDLVVEFSEESPYRGFSCVLEAKRDKAYTMKSILEELDEAMKNRGSRTAVFVMAPTHAPKGYPSTFARFGNKILIRWDHTNPDDIHILKAALVVGLALACRTEKRAEQGDIEALLDVEKRILAELSRYEKMSKLTGNLMRDSNKVHEELNRGKAKLNQLLDKGKEVLKALHVEVKDDAEEEASPVDLPEMNEVLAGVDADANSESEEA